jgi:hypothetical protein
MRFLSPALVLERSSTEKALGSWSAARRRLSGAARRRLLGVGVRGERNGHTETKMTHGPTRTQQKKMRFEQDFGSA